MGGAEMAQLGHGPVPDGQLILVGAVELSGSHGQGMVPVDRGRKRTTRGVALVEFAIVALLLFTLIFGIIGYSYMMSFRQALTQAAAEGARAGALDSPLNAITAEQAALAAVNQALAGYKVDGTPLECGQAHLECIFNDPAECPAAPAEPVVCITVRYPYRNHPLLPAFPGLGLTYPSRLQFTSVVEVTPG